MSPLDEELAALRRRAYGPDADIGDDPGAQARLAHLERLHAGGTPLMPVTTLHPSGGSNECGEALERDAVNGAADPARSNHGAEGARASALSSAATNAPARAPSGMRRALPWVVGALGVVAALVTAIASSAVLMESPDEPPVEARLVALDTPPRGAVIPTLTAEDLILLETPDPVFVSHGRYGALAVWSTAAPHNWRCLAVTFQSDTWRFNCTVSSMDTVADVVIVPDLLPADAPGGPIPDWSTVRLVLHDDVVDVYIGRNDNPG